MADRLYDKSVVPDEKIIEPFLGQRTYALWRSFNDEIEQRYPGVFLPDWIYGGAKHGWALRYKKSKAFCTLVPERRSFTAVIVFGEQDRVKAENMLPTLHPELRDAYESAKTYADGKWVAIKVTDQIPFADLFALLEIKRAQRKGK